MKVSVTINMEEVPKQPIPDDEINFHAVSLERSELRKALRDIQGTPLERTAGTTISESLKSVKEKTDKFSIKEFGGISKAKERLKADKEEDYKLNFEDIE